MLHLAPSTLSRFVDVSGFDRVLNIYSGYLVCDMSYSIDVIHKGKRHSFLMINGLRDEAPMIYQDQDRLLVIEGSALQVVKLDGSHDVDEVHFPHDIRRVFRLKNGFLICHSAGCLLISADLQSQIWSFEDERASEVTWRDGELRVYYGEHTSIRIHPRTGEEVYEIETFSETEIDESEEQVILRFPIRTH
jgi:hypothetical protein